MRPCFLYPMQPRCSLRHLWLPPRQNCPHCERVLLPPPRLPLKHALLPLSVGTSTSTLCSPMPAWRSPSLFRYYTKVRLSPTAPPRAINWYVPHHVCLGKHLRTARFRQSIPRRRRRVRAVHVHQRSRSQHAWILTVKQKLTAALLFPYTLYANLHQRVSVPHYARPTSAFNPPNHMYHCPSTRCTAVPGPKSGSNPIAGHIPKASSYLLLFCMPILRGASVRITEPRVGGAVDRHPPEAIRWQPLHATNTAKPFGLSLNEAPNLKAIRKRSLFRALRRLDRTGSTTYRGHRFTLPLADISPRTPPRSIRPQLDGRARPRLHVMSWNAGGLSSDRYQQLLLWLQGPGKHLHVVAVQETHWRHDASYKVPGWHAYHFPCSATDKSAGILILVNQLLYPPHKVQLTCLVEGRLIHLRLELNPSIDVLILYQHLYAASAQHKGQEGLNHAQAQRSKVWTKVHHSLSGFPCRNSVLLLGDFNTDLFPEPPHVGPGVRTRLSKQPPDQHELQQLLKTFSLCALNCWRRAGTQAQTFLPATGQRGTQIDFILTRLPQADGLARTCAPTWLPFVEDSGMRHLPILGSIPMPSLPKRSQHTSPQLSLASVRQTLRTHPDIALTYATTAAHLLKDSTPDTISSKLQAAWLQCKPPPCTQPAGPGAHTQAIMQLWELRRARRLFLSSRAPTDVTPWPMESDLRSKTKALKQACKQSKQDRIQRILDEAELAAQKGLTAVYQVVRKLAPKSARKPILFRDQAGVPLSTEQEVANLKDYFRTLYRSDHPEPVPPGNSFPSFTKAELQGALLQLPQGKALPSWVVPSPLWALAATPIADILHPALQDWCGNMHTDMPGDWPISALCLLNKPSKPPKAPENLRPIALLHPVSKCLATLAAERLRPYVYDLACRFPQFAYVGMRSVEDAIERACAHCAAARTVLAGQKYNLHRRREGHTVGHCKGGLTLSLDLSRAFDCLPREVLHASLRFAQVDAELIDLILHIHRHSKLRIDHKDHRILVELHSGVRQGCSLSPALWSIFICYTLHLLSSRVPLAALTAFSDDILAQWIIDSPQDVLSALKDMAFIIDTLTSLGMSVSDAKTVILDGLRGPQKSRLLKPLLKQHPDRGPCLQLACSRGFLDLPFRHSHTYLGIKLSYGPFERLTLQLRLKQGWSNFSRLFTLLRSNHIKPQQRLQLWQACVFTAIRYGLTSVGLPPDGPDKLRQAVAKQLRLVLKSPSWISHESNADLYHRYQIEDPFHALCRLFHTKQSRDRSSLSAFETDNLVQWRSVLNAHFQRAEPPPSAVSSARPREVTNVVAQNHLCPHCSQTFPTLIALRGHITRTHTTDAAPPGPADTRPTQRTLRHQFMSLALDGMPTCKLCLKQFAAWPPFLNHHATRSCPGRPLLPSDADESADVAEALSLTAVAPSKEKQIPLAQPSLSQPLPSPIRPPWAHASISPLCSGQ